MIRRKLVAAATLVLAAVGLTAPLNAPAASASSTHALLLINDHSHTCVDVPGGDPARGIKVQLWDCWGGNMQRWWLDDAAYTGTAYYRIRNAQTNKCLDIPGGDPANGVQVQQWDCWGDADTAWMQQWQEVQLGNNLVQFRNRATGKCIDDPGGSLIRGIVLQQWDCWGKDMQRWTEY